MTEPQKPSGVEPRPAPHISNHWAVRKHLDPTKNATILVSVEGSRLVSDQVERNICCSEVADGHCVGTRIDLQDPFIVRGLR